MESAGQKDDSSDDSLPKILASVPLAVDDSPLDASQIETLDDIQEDIERHRTAARTLFHQPRGDNDTVNSTRSLYDWDVVYSMIHGRRYCGDYYMPNDEEEQTRLQILHEVYLHFFDGKLTTIPLHDPEKILDIGTGTGEWAMAMGDEYPDAEVIGTDIAKIQPSAVPLNVYFEIDDAEEEGGWTWPDNQFDLVHFRQMAGAFMDWTAMYKEAFRHLKPGGWIEVLDYDNHTGFLSYFGADKELNTWLQAINEASIKVGRPRGDAHLQPSRLTDLGFVDVTLVEKVIPIGVWPEDKEAQKIGKHFLVAQLCGLEAICLRNLTEVQGWDVEEVRRVCTVITDRMKAVALDAEKAKGLGLKMKVLVGRKPGGTEKGLPDEESIMTMTNTNGEPTHEKH